MLNRYLVDLDLNDSCTLGRSAQQGQLNMLLVVYSAFII